jgi:acyl carrier protein
VSGIADQAIGGSGAREAAETPTARDVARAIDRRARRLIGAAAPAVADAERGGAELALDSLRAVELLIACGDELDLPLLDLAEGEDLFTLGGLARTVVQHADATALRRFCAEAPPD